MGRVKIERQLEAWRYDGLDSVNRYAKGVEEEAMGRFWLEDDLQVEISSSGH